MPKVKEAAVAVTGLVIDVEALVDFTTKQADGSMKYLISTGDGFASVKVQARDRDVLGLVNFGQQVGWIVRYGAYARDGSDAQATCAFQRTITEDDLDKIVSATTAKQGK